MDLKIVEEERSKTSNQVVKKPFCQMSNIESRRRNDLIKILLKH